MQVTQDTLQTTTLDTINSIAHNKEKPIWKETNASRGYTNNPVYNVNKDDITSFAELLLDYGEGVEPTEVRFLRGSQSKSKILELDNLKDLNTIEQLNSQGWNVYVVINKPLQAALERAAKFQGLFPQRLNDAKEAFKHNFEENPPKDLYKQVRESLSKELGGSDAISDDDIEHVNAIFVDIDKKHDNARAILENAPLPSSLVIQSSFDFKLHAYWILDDFLPVEMFTQTQKKLIDYFTKQGLMPDSSIINPARIMRLPGTWRFKGDDTPMLAQILCSSTERVSANGELKNNWFNPYVPLEDKSENNSTNEAPRTREFVHGGWKKLKEALLQPPETFKVSRHNCSKACLNVASDAGKLQDMLTFLKSQNLYKAWFSRDPAREIETWRHEVDQWLGATEKGKRSGIPTLTQAGFELPNGLFKDGEKTVENKPLEIVNTALEHIKELFLDADDEGEAFAVTKQGQMLRVNSSNFKAWLQMVYLEGTSKSSSRAQIDEAIFQLANKAVFEGNEKKLYTRIASCDGCIYVDLANDAGEVVKIDSEGWSITTECPITFRSGYLPLITPEYGGSVDLLKPLVNLTDDNFRLLAAFLVGSLNPDIAYPVLVVSAEHESGKSRMLWYIKRLLRGEVDYNEQALPESEQDLMADAMKAFLPCYDNITSISKKLSDAFCRLSAGNKVSRRALYTNGDSFSQSAKRPVILGGIGEFATRGDIVSRSVTVNMSHISDADQKLDSTLDALFEERKGKILGALFDAVSAGLSQDVESVANHYKNQGYRLPRRADFGAWAASCESALGFEKDSIMSALAENVNEALMRSVEDHPTTPYLIQLVLDNGGTFEGTCKEILTKLKGLARVDDAKGLPDTAKGLGSVLERNKAGLRLLGLTVESKKGSGKRRILKKLSYSPPLNDESLSWEMMV